MKLNLYMIWNEKDKVENIPAIIKGIQSLIIEIEQHDTRTYNLYEGETMIASGSMSEQQIHTISASYMVKKCRNFVNDRLCLIK